MSMHFHREMERIKKRVLALSAIVEEDLRIAIRSVRQRDVDLARKVIANDDEIDAMEIGVEEECLKILALYQPVASDLRFIISVLKMNNELERIGDLSKNISKRSLRLAAAPPITIPEHLDAIAEKTVSMLKMSLDALVELDALRAHEVCLLDDEVDAINSSMFAIIKEAFRRDPDNIDQHLDLLSVSRYLERIADHATNIAEDVVYLVQGKIIRHAGKPSREPGAEAS